MIAGFRRRPTWIVAPVVLAAAVAASCALTGPVTRGDAAPKPATPSAIGSVEAAAAPEAGFPSPLPVNVGTSASKHDSNVQEAALVKLNATLDELRFNEVPLGKVLTFFSDASGLNVHVNWKALSSEGIDANTPVSAALSNVPARKALQLLLGDVGGGGGKIDYVLDDGVVTISTRSDIDFIASRAVNAVRSGTAASATYQQVAEAEARVAALRNELAELTANKAPAAQLDETQRQLTLAESMVRDAQASAMVASSPVNAVLEAPAGADSPMKALQSQLQDLDAAQAALMQKVGPNHPQLQAMQAQIGLLQERMAKARGEMGKSAAPAAKAEMQVYDVHDLLDVPGTQQGALTAEQQATLKDLVGTIVTTMNDEAMSVSAFNGMLVVKAPDESQNQLREMLANLQAAHGRRVATVQERVQKAEAAGKH